jgi:hypothetical protein
MIKKYRSFINESKSHQEIRDICTEYRIWKKHSIHEDGTVDVDGNVDLSGKNLKELPLKFGKVSGNFFCNTNQLTSLEGCPTTVGKDFSCDNNKLTSLKGCPTTVGGYFWCDNNQLTSLEGCPREVGNSFDCNGNQLTSLKGSPLSVGGNFGCSDNPQLVSFEGFPEKHKKNLWVKTFKTPLWNDIYSLFLLENDIGGWAPFPEHTQHPIHMINEWEVIDPEAMEVSYLRLSEVYKELGREVPPPEDIKFNHYTLVD